MVRADAYTGWSHWWSVEDWFDLMGCDSQRERDELLAFQYGGDEALTHWRSKTAGMRFVACTH